MRLFSGDGVCRKENDYLTDLLNSEKSLNCFLSTRPATTTPSSLDKEDLLLQVWGIPFVVLAVLGYLLLLSHLLNLFFYTLQEVKKHIKSLFVVYLLSLDEWLGKCYTYFFFIYKLSCLVTNQGVQVMGDIQLLRWAQTQFLQQQGNSCSIYELLP